MTQPVDGFPVADWLQLLEWIQNDPNDYRECMESGERPAVKLNTRLLTSLRELQPRIARKFIEPSQWVWSDHYLQLCSNQLTAEMIATHFPAEQPICDIGCGGGADAVALAKRGPVYAVDCSEFAVQLTRANSQLNLGNSKGSLTVNIAQAANLKLDSDTLVHLDPDRRQSNQRSVSLRWHSPDQETITQIVQSSSGGSMKLAPACDDSPDFLTCPIVKQWISFCGSVVQQRWWWGLHNPSENKRWISSYSIGIGWRDCWIQNDLTPAKADSIVYDGIELAVGAFIGDGDPALRAAKCQAGYIHGHDSKLIGNSNGFYLSHDPIDDLPLIQWRRIEAVLPLRAKKIQQYLKDNGRDGIELKPRNLPSLSPEIQKIAKLRGASRCFVYATMVGDKAYAIIADNLP